MTDEGYLFSWEEVAPGGSIGSRYVYQLDALISAAHRISRISDIIKMHKCTTLWSTPQKPSGNVISLLMLISISKKYVTFLDASNKYKYG